MKLSDKSVHFLWFSRISMKFLCSTIQAFLDKHGIHGGFHTGQGLSAFDDGVKERFIFRKETVALELRAMLKGDDFRRLIVLEIFGNASTTSLSQI